MGHLDFDPPPVAAEEQEVAAQEEVAEHSHFLSEDTSTLPAKPSVTVQPAAELQFSVPVTPCQ